MIVLDTNVISEVTRVDPDPGVIAWLDRLPPGTAYLTVIAEAELLFGIEILPRGRRRDRLALATARAVDGLFSGRILPFDSRAAAWFAKLGASRRTQGRPIPFADAQIAAIVRAHGATLATRNTDDFAGCGIQLVNPWKS